MTAVVQILSPTSSEKIRVTVTSPGDPTGGDVKFQMTTKTSNRQPSTSSEYPATGGAWKTGEYSGSFVSGEVTALTPLNGSTGFGGTAGEYWLWCQFVVGSETIERLVGIVQIGGE